MKKTLLFSLFTFATFTFSLAQGGPPAGGAPRGGFQAQGPSITGKVTGQILDSLSKQAVEFATIVLVNTASGKDVDGGLTETDGKFKLPEVKTGKYEIRISFLGYQAKTIPGIELTPSKPDFDAGTIWLTPEGIQLNEVTVTGEAALIENRIDKMVYNAEKDATVAGGDASEVLRRVPTLSVDLEGNVSLRGSSSIQILINGKPSGMFASNPSDALKMIPADQIKSVEVITTPSAKYDAEGSGGIINIITKQKRAQGFSGSVNGSIGNVQNNAVLNLNLVQGRFGFNGTGSTFFSWPREGFSNFLREDYSGGVTSILSQKGENSNARIGFNSQLGAFYDFNAYNSINSSFRLNGFHFDQEGNINATYTNPLLAINQIYSRNNTSERLNSGFDWNTDYRRTFPNSEREFSVGVQLSGNQSNANIDFLQEGNDPTLFKQEQNINNGDNLETTVQMDYVHPFNKKVKLETGAKGVLRRIVSDFEYNAFDPDLAVYQIDLNRTDIFNYDQDVVAGYASFNFTLGEKTGLIAGARYEHTQISGIFDQRNELKFSNQYDNLLPSVAISRKLSQMSNLRLSYSRRIQRPSLFYINPFVDNNDPRNVQSGNPYLDPELVNQVELGYNNFIKGSPINLSLYTRQTNGVIQQFLQVVDGVSITEFGNIGKEETYGATFFSSVTIKKILTLRGSIDAQNVTITSTSPDLERSNNGWQFNGNANASLALKNGLRIETFAFGRSSRITLQGRVPSFSIWSVGMRKELFKKKGSIGLNVVEPFSKFKSFNSELSGENFYQKNEFKVLFRSVGMNFSYQFGKVDFNQQQRQRRRRGVSNDDLKGGEDNNF